MPNTLILKIVTAYLNKIITNKIIPNNVRHIQNPMYKSQVHALKNAKKVFDNIQNINKITVYNIIHIHKKGNKLLKIQSLKTQKYPNNKYKKGKIKNK